MKPLQKELKCINFAKQFCSKPKTSKNIFQKLFGNKTIKKENEYEVSTIKTFTQLWSDFGLRDFGVEYCIRGFFNRENKLDCIKFWVKELYEVDIDIIKLEEEIKRKLIKSRQEIMKNNPGISGVIMAEPVDEIPEEIDFLFGYYE